MDDDKIVFDKAKWHYEGKFPKEHGECSLLMRGMGFREAAGAAEQARTR